MDRKECLKQLMQMEDRMARNECATVDLERLTIYKLINNTIEMLQEEESKIKL